MEPHNGLKRGQAVRIVSEPRFRGTLSPGGRQNLQIGAEGFVTRLGGDNDKFHGEEHFEKTHVVFNRDPNGTNGTWIEAVCLEPIDDEADIQEALRSISEAAKHQEHVLMFKSITVTDADGKELTVRVEGQQVYIGDSYDDDLMSFDLDTWTNIQEVIDLSFRQINPTHVGRER